MFVVPHRRHVRRNDEGLHDFQGGLQGKVGVGKFLRILRAASLFGSVMVVGDADKACYQSDQVLEARVELPEILIGETPFPFEVSTEPGVLCPVWSADAE